MKYEILGGNIKVLNINSLDLAETFECGQCFRWDSLSDGSFMGAAFGKSLRVSIKEGALFLYDLAENDYLDIWQEYFDLNLDYDKIRKDLSSLDETLYKAAKYAPGIRILKQDPWEALCSFIISQNNNIPRIKGIILRLCQNFGDKINPGSYSFPNAERLANLDERDLDTLRCGFRSSYILDAAKKIASGEIDLKEVSELPLDEARIKLMQIHGVGPKVADCTLLYGLHRLDAFPMDVWMKRAMSMLYPGKTPEMFGKYAGIAQQYIFHYSRSHPELFAR